MGENNCSWPLSFLPTDRNGPDCLFRRGLPVLIAGDLYTKHVNWKSRLNTTRGKLLRNYADENSCLIFGPHTPTTKTLKSSAPPEVLDIMMGKDLQIPVYLSSCSALSSDNLPVLIYIECLSSFHHPPLLPDFRRTDWAKLRPFTLRSVGRKERGKPKIFWSDCRPLLLECQ